MIACAMANMAWPLVWSSIWRPLPCPEQNREFKQFWLFERHFEKSKKHSQSTDYRIQEHPRTPDHTLAISNRNWLGQIRVWREALHKFDDVTFEDDELRKYPLSRKMNLILKAHIGDLCPATGQNFDVVLGPQYLPATGDLTERFIAAIESDSLI